mmetsp:Transcript_18221/g.69095  ORF Transcript_18221/g.69095 Transcript_18221/m.69095 type:complete len:206 (-) Transcript_18221:239-856(-)
MLVPRSAALAAPVPRQGLGHLFLLGSHLHGIAVGRIVPQHGEGLAGSRLAVGEARCVSPFAGALDQLLHAPSVDRSGVVALVKRVVETEGMLLDAARQIDLDAWFTHDDSAPRPISGNADDVVVAPGFPFQSRLFPAPSQSLLLRALQGTLADDDANLHLGVCFSLRLEGGRFADLALQALLREADAHVHVKLSGEAHPGHARHR